VVTDDDGATSVGADEVSINVVASVDPNVAPTANAGVDQTVDEGVTVILDSAGSSDPDGTVDSYQWSQVSGPAATILNAGNPTASLIAPDVSGDPKVLERVSCCLLKL